MKIQKVSLKNIRCFEGEHTLSFAGTINLFVGKNGSGKSTILRCLGVNQGMLEQHNFARPNSTDSEIVIEFDRLDENSKSLMSNFRVNDNYRPVFRSVLKANKISHAIASAEKASPWLTILPGQFAPKDPGYLFFPFLSKRRPIQYSDEVNAEKASSISMTQDFLYSKVNALKSSNKYKERFSEICQKILGRDIETYPSSRGVTAGIIPDDAIHLPLSDLGDGTGQMLGLLVGLLTARDKIFLIEELENDIHPSALKTLLEAVAESSRFNQFFISTHSNIVLMELGSVAGAKVFNVEAEQVPGLPRSRVHEIDNTPAEKLAVLRDLGYHCSDFGLYACYLILEESSAESFINQLLIPLFVPDLVGRIRTVSAAGANNCEARVRALHSLFLFTHQSPVYKDRCWIFLDGDAKGKEVREKLVEGRYYQEHKERVICLSRDQFEEYLPGRFQQDAASLLRCEYDEKSRKKSDLIKQVIAWVNRDAMQARRELEESAKEVICNLQRINAQISE